MHTMEKIMIKIFDAKPAASHIVSLNLFLCLCLRRRAVSLGRAAV